MRLIRRRPCGSEDLRLLLGEFLVGQHSLLVELCDLGEQVDVDGPRVRRWSGWGRRILLGRILLGRVLLGRVLLGRVRGLILLRPAPLLPARHAIAHGGEGAGDDGGAGDATDESHVKRPFVSRGRSSGAELVEAGDDRLDWDAAARDELAAGHLGGAGEGEGPEVFIDDHQRG